MATFNVNGQRYAGKGTAGTPRAEYYLCHREGGWPNEVVGTEKKVVAVTYGSKGLSEGEAVGAWMRGETDNSSGVKSAGGRPTGPGPHRQKEHPQAELLRRQRKGKNVL